MIAVPEIFKARADSFGETMIGGSGVVSFRLPEYQRLYDWNKANVLRLLQDCSRGLAGLATSNHGSQHHYTFLGTVILATDTNKEPEFEGKSLLVVDGQQRLTTLMLLSCVLFKTIRNHETDIENVSDVKVQEWLKAECEEQLIRLYQCTTGQRHGLSQTTPFPRLVRSEEDIRSHSSDSRYTSDIASFFNEFGLYCKGACEEFPSTASQHNSYVLSIFEYIHDLIQEYVYQGKDTPSSEEADLPVIQRDTFGQIGCRALFTKLDSVGTETDQKRVVANIASSPEAEGLIRLLLFSAYVVQSVVLTIVQAPDEDIAFEIFDALNTTGEPLTALETLKPHIVRFESERCTSYSGSESESWWGRLETNVINAEQTPDQRQRKSKELVTNFALYYLGEKLGSDLGLQRNTLRNYFTRAGRHGDNVARKLIKSLARLSDFSVTYWDKECINGLAGPVSQSAEYDALKLCMRFIIDTNTTTVIPILARYWDEFDEMDEETTFLKAVKAVTAFLALRRAMTGGTQRIDSDFRSIMSHTDVPLCLGSGMSNRIPNIDELRSRFRELLAARPFNVRGKNEWLDQARETPLANANRVICRFLLLAAAHNALPDKDDPGLMKSEGVIPSDDRKFLSYSIWTDERYTTLEHVAPSNPNGGWDAGVYQRQVTRDTIGNLVLLPERENQSIGNSPWNKKKLFYQALMAKTERERESAITSAENQGLKFPKRTLDLIRGQKRLHILDPLGEVDEWTAQLIEERTENTLSLAWDQLATWIFD